MKAMILAAGRGERLRPLTDHTPKPLLQVGPLALIEHHLLALKNAGFEQVVINVSHLGDQIQARLGDGSSYGVSITWSVESEGALETGGGIRQALSLLGDSPFVVINGDILSDFPLATLKDRPRPQDLAHLVLIDNPEHHPNGDFACVNRRALNAGMELLTFSGIGVYRPELFATLPTGKFPLAPILREAIRHSKVSAEHFRGSWIDVGTPERLAQARCWF